MEKGKPAKEGVRRKGGYLTKRKMQVRNLNHY
jgi:hypothetical protein